MSPANHTAVTYFIIRGISDLPELQLPIFLLVLHIYIITVGGNTTILLLVCLDRYLHTPMYFFLSNLSVLDTSSTTITLHKILVKNTISFPLCMLQLYCFMSFVGIEILLLTAMSYDRYVAICYPLRYQIIMDGHVYVPLATICWVLGFVETIPCICIYTGFSCFKTNVVNHFFCDLNALMEISCSNTKVLKNVILYESIFSGFIPFLLTCVSYTYIIKTILGMHSKDGRRKAFYTCASHLTIVALFYVTLFFLYLKPRSSSLDSEKLLSLLYTVVVPMLNPLIYSLKNKDVKSALRHRLPKSKMSMLGHHR
uniref:Olfactory receptor n=1 Tax=Leptobrachium leishanense TaxID=445787 RepID=A0A8C5MHV3_9ANUR